MAKRVQISADGNAPWYTLPGNSAELRNEAGELNDTIFGQDFASSETGLISWTLQSNAVYKGFAGYIVSLKKSGTPTTMTAQATALVTGKIYQIVDTTKRIIDPESPITVLDNAVDHTADVVRYDILAGIVEFEAGYTVTGPVTITAKYLPIADIAGSKSFTLSQTAETVDETDIPTAKANGGFMVYTQGLKTVNLELQGVYKVTNGWFAGLTGRDTLIVEINPDNGGHSLCRGVFKYASQGQSGDVGALEEETVSLRLSVPDIEGLDAPFKWYHDGSTTLNGGVRILLDAWLAGDNVHMRYLPDGLAGFEGEVVVTDISLAGGIESMNEFTVNLQGTDAPVEYP